MKRKIKFRKLPEPLPELTETQREVLTKIKEMISKNHFPPTRSEISHAMGYASANAAQEHLEALAKKGAIELYKGVSRGIVILP